MKRLLFGLFFITLFTIHNVSAQVLTEWVENRGANENNVIALGYPVPIPVNTPLPFDGFRTYAGLHMRHQDLAVSTDYVHPEQIGTTFSGRTIWAYRLGDNDKLTFEGIPEPATLTNGGIHAREWQTPEVVTGILELFALHENDNHFYDYLRDNVNMIVIPSLNIDGFMQTQRTPSLNYLQSDPDFPDTSPRDGRMRRKNMRGADEDLTTTGDLLNGVDLNRNNYPYWSTSPNRSSDSLMSIVHHGTSPQSESEIVALDAAAALGPVGRLRIYTDVHSYSQVHFWTVTENDRLSRQTEEVLKTFTDHHITFPAAKWYAYPSRLNISTNQGIGTTDEYFTNVYRVPSWTLEVEPTNGQSFHQPLPGNGADYGGVAENGHDGFILPESEIRRVREELAQSFAAVYFRQAGPPSIQSLRLTDIETGAVVYQGDWQAMDAFTRELHANQHQPLQLERDYELWLSFTKPMRWRKDGIITTFPGQPESGLALFTGAVIGGAQLTTATEQTTWQDQPGGVPDGYANYQDDTVKMTITFPGDTQNRGLVVGDTMAALRLRSSDMTGMRIDANPATVANWGGGNWTSYDNSSGNDSDFGGYDTSIAVQMTDQAVAEPFLVDAGISASWFNVARDGEGFLLEMLAPDSLGVNRVLMFWYTYDKEGNQHWYQGVGFARGNSLDFPEVWETSGAVFGPDFDPADVARKLVGNASFVFTNCNEGSMSYRINKEFGRMDLTRLTSIMWLPCPPSPPPVIFIPVPDEAKLSGSWYDPTHDGEGFNIEVLMDGRVLVFWFTYDKQGNQRWLVGVGVFRDGKIVVDDLQTTHGGIFGPDFDPVNVERTSWGSLLLDIDCNGGTANYNSTDEEFGSGVLNVVKLTEIDSTNPESDIRCSSNQ
jgi:hypothetical protein